MSRIRLSFLLVLSSAAFLGCPSEIPTAVSGEDATRYYVSATGCAGGNVSYSGYDYATCNSYYRVAASRSCTKILDNCR